MAEQKFKTEIKSSLDGLVIPDLQNIINQYVKLTALDIPAECWQHRHYFRQNNCLPTTVTLRRGEASVLDEMWCSCIHWANCGLRWAYWDGPEITATFDATSIIKRAREFQANDRIIFTFSDSDNWSFELQNVTTDT